MNKSEELMESINEMTNLGKREHGLPIDIKMNVLQPGLKKLKHGPRIKIFRGSGPNKSEFILTISASPNLVAGSVFVTNKQYKMILNFVSNNSESLLKFWNDSDMSITELVDLFKNT